MSSGLATAGLGVPPRALPVGGPRPARPEPVSPSHLGRRALVALVGLVVAVLAATGCSSSTSGQGPADGTYTVAVALSGGSGKATVASPTTLVVAGDTMTAEVTWSSPYYTWMEVGGTRYTPISAQGEDATFGIPVTLDTDLAVSAETVAMSQPHTIDYTLRFDSASLESAG